MDTTIKNDRYERMKKTTHIHYAMEMKRSLAEIVDDFPDNPKGMDYFYKKYENFDGEKNNSLTNEKVIATMCVHVPTELIYAAGAKPVRLCSGAYSTDQIGAEFLPAKTCPLIKSTLGAIFMDILPGNIKPKMIVNPSTCDQKRKLGEISAEISKQLYLLEVPPTKDSEEAQEYWQRSIKKFIKNLEKVTGNKITRGKLKKAIKLIYEAQLQFRRLYNLRKEDPVIWGKDAILLTNAYFFDDIIEWTKNLKLLNDELQYKKKQNQFVAKENSPRILLTGSPAIFPNMKLPVLVEKTGGVVVAEEYCSTSRLLHDTVAVDEWFLYDMIPAVADRYLKPCTCPNFTPNTDRLRKLIEMIKEFSVDGVIYQSFAGCQLYDLESRQVGNSLEKNGTPMLYLETDYNSKDDGQLSTRVEAFVESLKTKKSTISMRA